MSSSHPDPRPAAEVLPADRTRRQQAALRVAERFASMLDTKWKVPGLPIRFGFDSLIGLVPVVGDVAGAGFGLAVLLAAREAGVRKRTLGRMAANLAIDGSVGSVPVLGDAFDVAFKSHQRNLRLLRRDLGLDPDTGQPAAS